ncbi:unnamed protein product [Schistosoma margrebowiei]|uniref:Uncharacterized protein n=1 Tax=Schistosoma margrebowiei TaxID=48269 RepID=A0A183LX20_9TREM|nr:unnamed protein product [Schistosoma margrebowiei]
MESNWKGIKEAITSTCHEVLDHKKHHHKEWITVDTLDKIQQRRHKKAAINASRTRAEKVKAQAEYTEVNKQVKRSIRTDKRKYVEDLAMTVSQDKPSHGILKAKEHITPGNGQLYDITKKLSGNRRKPERPVKSKEGEQRREKKTSVAAALAAISLNIHEAKTRILRYITACTNPVTIDGEDLEDVKTFTNLGSIIDEQGESNADVKARIGKARSAYLQLRNI